MKDNKKRLFEVMGKLDKTFNNKKLPCAQEYLGDLIKWLNMGESKVESDKEHKSTTYVLDIPKAEYSDELYDTIKKEYEFNSDGTEENSKRNVTHSNVESSQDMGKFVRIHLNFQVN